MKPGSIKTGRILLGLLFAGLFITLISWDHRKTAMDFRTPRFVNDTVPKQKQDAREKKVRDLDEALEELDDVDLKIEMERAEKEIREAMKQIDSKKIKMEIEKAMKEVNMAAIEKEIKESMADLRINLEEMKESLKEINSDKIKGEIEKAMKEVSDLNIEKEIKESMAKVDWEKMNREMEKVKTEMEKIGPQLQKEMETAKIEIEKTKKEMREYRDFVNDLEKDGLLKKSEGYSISHKDGELIINGKKASADTYSKYRSFLEKHKQFHIKKSDDDFDFDMN